MKRTSGSILSILLLAGCASSPAPSAADKTRLLTVEAVLELNDKLKLAPFGGWIGSGHEYLATEGAGAEARLRIVDAASGASRPFHDEQRMERALASLPGVDAEQARSFSRRTELELSNSASAALLDDGRDLFAYHFDSGRAVRLTDDPAEESAAVFSPDGVHVSYVRDSNLHVVPSAGGEARALTTGGDAQHLYGKLDWVYQEEVYGRGDFQAHWWSPDSRRIALLSLDETEVPEYTIADTRTVHPKLEVWRYPKAGDPNPRARLGVVSVDGGGPRFFEFPDHAADTLIVRVSWTPDSREIFAQLQDRTQTWLDLVAIDVETGAVRRLYRDRTPAWVMPVRGPLWLEGGEEFVVSSERDGYEHLYLYKRSGELVRRLTSGEYEIDGLHRVDARARRVWFDSKTGDVKGVRLFEVSLDGGEPVAVSPEPGTHSIAISPDGAYFVDTHVSHERAPARAVREISGRAVRELARADGELLRPYGCTSAEFHRPKTRDGFQLEALLYKPLDFDPRKKYPLLCFTYSGPNAPQVKDAFHNLNALYHQLLVQRGYLVWVCDNRSASGKGLISAAAAYKRFGPEALADLEDGLDYLCAQGFVDESRIGMWGWSFGGYMTAFALTHSKRFKLGIAGAPVTDWRLYDSIYTERYLGLPAENEAGYAAASVVAAAADLSGRLLVICGEIDENVHAQNTLQLAEALQKAGKQFDLMVYPGNRHGIVEPSQRRHLYAMMADYVTAHL